MRTIPTAILAVAAAGAAACGHAPPRPEVVWPDPPEKPRVKYVMSIRTPQDIGLTGWEAFTRALLGGPEKMVISKPAGIALSEDGNRIYVSDSRLVAVVVIALAEHTMRNLAPDEPMSEPAGVGLDAQENVYVALPRERRVAVFSKDGKRIRTIGWGDLERPTGLVVDKKRELLYVADTASTKSDKHRVLVYGLEGKLLRSIGTRGEGEGQFNFPVFLALDAAGHLYVADTLNFRIHEFDVEGRFVRMLGEQGDVPGTFNSLKGIAFDGFGNLYVVEGKGAVVQMFNKDFDLLMWFAGLAPKWEYLELPIAIAIDQRKNRIYVGDAGGFGRINVYDLINTKAEDAIRPPGLDLSIKPGQADQPGRK